MFCHLLVLNITSDKLHVLSRSRFTHDFGQTACFVTFMFNSWLWRDCMFCHVHVLYMTLDRLHVLSRSCLMHDFGQTACFVTFMFNAWLWRDCMFCHVHVYLMALERLHVLSRSCFTRDFGSTPRCHVKTVAKTQREKSESRLTASVLKQDPKT